MSWRALCLLKVSFLKIKSKLQKVALAALLIACLILLLGALMLEKDKLEISTSKSNQRFCDDGTFLPESGFPFKYMEFCGSDSWRFCALEGDICIPPKLSSRTFVAKYGIKGQFVTGSFSGEFKCDSQAFDDHDPFNGKKKICLVQHSGVGSVVSEIGFYDDFDRAKGNVFENDAFLSEADSGVRQMTFVTLAEEDGLIRKNLFGSQVFLRKNSKHELLRYVPSKESRLAAVYGKGLERAKHDVVVFVHPDVYLPPFWEERIERRLKEIESFDKKWAFVGNACAGGPFGVCDFGVSRCFFEPRFPDTTCRFPDENLLIINRRSGLRWDHMYPSHHGFGALLSLEAEHRNLKGYGVDYAVTLHKWRDRHGQLLNFSMSGNWMKRYEMEKEGVQAMLSKYFTRRWKKYLPIRTLTFNID